MSPFINISMYPDNGYRYIVTLAQAFSSIRILKGVQRSQPTTIACVLREACRPSYCTSTSQPRSLQSPYRMYIHVLYLHVHVYLEALIEVETYKENTVQEATHIHFDITIEWLPSAKIFNEPWLLPQCSWWVEGYVHVMPEAAHFSLKNDCLGELHCVALGVSWSEYFMYM